MATICFRGQQTETCGDLPRPGTPAPDFVLVKTDLSELSLKELRGTRVVLNIFPSIDTPVCAASVRRFNQEAGSLKNTAVLCVSRDLPFAQARFCGAEGLSQVNPASDFREGAFGRAYGVLINSGPLTGLLARAVVLVNKEGSVTHAQLVPDIAREPDYAAVLAALV